MGIAYLVDQIAAVHYIKNSEQAIKACSDVVRLVGLEPTRITAREPKSRMSTNSVTGAYMSGKVCSAVFILIILLGAVLFIEGIRCFCHRKRMLYLI